MPVIFKCECGQYLSVQNKYVNKKLICPNCNELVTVPSPAELSAVESDVRSAPSSHRLEKVSEDIEKIEKNDQVTALDSDFSLFDKGKQRCPHCGVRNIDSQTNKCSLCGLEIQ